MVNPNWTTEEMILAADLADDLGWIGVNAKTRGILELSQLLNRAKFHPDELKDVKFRNPNSVGMKINNLKVSHPQHKAGTGKGLRPSKAEVPIVEAFVDQRLLMKSIAREIRRQMTLGNERQGMLEDVCRNMGVKNPLDA